MGAIESITNKDGKSLVEALGVINDLNGEYKYVPIKVMYEPGTFPGLDDFGNIVLSSKLEIPVLHGGFNYYMNKTNDKKVGLSQNNCMRIQTVQIYFI